MPDTRAGRSWVDLPYLAGEPCVCCRLNGTSGYHHDKECPACEGSGVVKNPDPIAEMLRRA
jgi:DnaJ-class molecular chaperone